MPTTLGFAHFPVDQLPADLALLVSSEHQELRDEFEIELLSADSKPDNLEEFGGSEPEDLDHLTNFRRLRELLSHCTFVFEAYEDNGLLYGYWHGSDDSISVRDAAMVTYDSEGQITFDPDQSILEELCYQKAFLEAEMEGGDERELLAQYRQRFAADGVDFTPAENPGRKTSLELAVWIECVGKHVDDPGVQDALADVGMGAIPMMDGSCFDLSLGATVNFGNASELEFLDPALGQQAGDRAVLQYITVRTNKYRGSLPLDIPIAATRAGLRDLLGEPRSSEDDECMDEWVVDQLLVTVFYADDFASMKSLIFACGE